MTDATTHGPDRRTVLKGAAAGALTAGALAAGAGLELATPAYALTASGLPKDPDDSGIDHIVVVMMENRSFDHFLGWLEGADGRQAGLRYPKPGGGTRATWHLDTWQGLDYADPDHSYDGGRSEYHGGKCDGWLLTESNDEFAVGYYTQKDLAFFGKAAPHWTVCDRFFSSIMSSTYPNRFYMHAAQTDRIDNDMTISSLPTIWDRLAEAGVSHRYYFSDIPLTALWGAKHLAISGLTAEFLLAARLGTLPAVSFIDPRFLGEDGGYSGDDHPHADIRVGQHFLNRIYHAVTTGPAWRRTALVITYDEWGGFFDHVRPTTAPDPVPAHALRGFRIPTVVISPRARRRHVAHAVYDHTSILKMIEWRFGLRPLTVRDQHARNLAEVLDFAQAPDLTAPQYDVPAPHTLVPQPKNAVGTPLATDHEEDWIQLRKLALRHGFTLG